MCMSIMHATACHTAYCVVVLSFIMLLYRPECVWLENPVTVGIVFCVLWFHVSAYVINFSNANACKLCMFDDKTVDKRSILLKLILGNPLKEWLKSMMIR